MAAINPRCINSWVFGFYNLVTNSYKAHKFERTVIVEDLEHPDRRCETDLSNGQILSLFGERDKRLQKQGYRDPVRPQQYLGAFDRERFYRDKIEISEAEFEKVEQMDPRYLISRVRHDEAEITIIRGQRGVGGGMKYKIRGKDWEIEKYIYPLDQIPASTVPKVLAVAALTLVGSFVWWQMKSTEF